jgi:hypothetical protein
VAVVLVAGCEPDAMAELELDDWVDVTGDVEAGGPTEAWETRLCRTLTVPRRSSADDVTRRANSRSLLATTLATESTIFAGGNVSAILAVSLPCPAVVVGRRPVLLS